MLFLRIGRMRKSCPITEVLVETLAVSGESTLPLTLLNWQCHDFLPKPMTQTLLLIIP
jgi:hypothetical protein